MMLTLLINFISHASKLYGDETLVYNMHCLCHLSADAKRFGELDSFSAFPFENFLGCIKYLLKKKSQPLPQICRRIAEGKLRPKKKSNFDTRVLPHTKLEEIDLPVHGAQFGTALWQGIRLSNDNKDHCIVLKNKKIIKIARFVLTEVGKIFVVGQVLNRSSPLFIYPCNSKDIFIFKFPYPNSPLAVYPFSDIDSKGILIPHKTELVFYPIVREI